MGGSRAGAVGGVSVALYRLDHLMWLGNAREQGGERVIAAVRATPIGNATARYVVRAFPVL